jgi:glycosyltransferase involved in cell wall biosynthesis
VYCATPHWRGQIQLSRVPFFSVVVPCYNRASTVGAVLKAVKNQTFEDFECLIIDDGSSDSEELLEVVKSLDDERFRYFRRENGGGAAARNTGIAQAKGKYIAFLDSDDFYLETKLSSDFEYINNAKDPKAVIFSQVLIDRGVGKLSILPARGPHSGENIGEYLMCHMGFTQTSTLVVERSLAESARFTEGLPMAQDFDFPIRLESKGARFIMKDKPYVIWMDIDDPHRVSHKPKYERMLQWSEDIRPLVGDKAVNAFRGSQIARLAAPTNKRLALKLLAEALVAFSMPPKLAVKSIIQILFPRTAYRRIRDFLIFVRLAR